MFISSFAQWKIFKIIICSTNRELESFLIQLESILTLHLSYNYLHIFWKYYSRGPNLNEIVYIKKKDTSGTRRASIHIIPYTVESKLHSNFLTGFFWKNPKNSMETHSESKPHPILFEDTKMGKTARLQFESTLNII